MCALQLGCPGRGTTRGGALTGQHAGPHSNEQLTAIMIRLHFRARAWQPGGAPDARGAWRGSGTLLAHKRVCRLMQAAGLPGRHPKAWKRTTVDGRPASARP